MSDLRAYILCRFAGHSGIYTSWMDESPLPCSIVDEYVPQWQLPLDAGIVITHMHYRWEEIHALRRILEQGRVPVLILADGILEYRNTWEHPDLADGAIFQPLVGHKLACIGRGQARTVESWGNLGKCEVVGLPRLDRWIDESTVSPAPSGSNSPFRLLVATASTPAFDQAQREAVVESLTHIRQRLENNSRVEGRPVQVIWRLTDGLPIEIGVESDDEPAELRPLSEVIDDVDAVITAPSTLYLESVLKKRPTALLDFYNSPHYVTSAWVINAPKHFNWILKELANPPPHKMLFQTSVLYDQLECETPALPRMLQLIDEMVKAGVSARQTGQPIKLPHRILVDPRKGFQRIPAEFELARLYPHNQAFQTQDVQRLQVELCQAIKRLDQLPWELAEKNCYIGELIRNLDQCRNRAASLHERIARLRKRLGIRPVQGTED